MKAVVQTRYECPEDVLAIGDLPEPKPRTGQILLRLTYLDHLRAALVALIIVHHVAMVYGAIAPFYYVEPPLDDPFACTLLGVFALTNQAWFMGTLFLLAGYFTPRSFDRRGASAFVRTWLVRLGIPTLVGVFVLIPLAPREAIRQPADAGYPRARRAGRRCSGWSPGWPLRAHRP